MALRVQNNLAALNTLRELNKTEREMHKTLERLSSGQKINRAGDAPADLVISEHMRSQIRSLGKALNNTENSISMIQTAEGALNEVSNSLVSLRQLVIHAANTGTNDVQMLEADQLEIDHLLNTLSQLAKNTQFGTRNLLDGSNATSGNAIGDGFEFVKAETTTKPSPAEGYKVHITQASTRAFLGAERALTLEDNLNQLEFVIKEGDRSVKFDLSKDLKFKDQLSRLSLTYQQMVADKGVNHPETIQRKADIEQKIQSVIAHKLQKEMDSAGLEIDVNVHRAPESFGKELTIDEITPNTDQFNFIAGLESQMEIGEDELLIFRHRKFGSEPFFSVSTNLPLFSKNSLLENGSYACNVGRDTEGTIGGSPETGGGEAAIGNGQSLTAAEGTYAEGLTIKYSGNDDIEIYEVFDALRRQKKGILIDRKNESASVDAVGESNTPEQEAEQNSKASKEILGYVHVTQSALAFQVGANQGQIVRMAIPSVHPKDLGKNVENDSGFHSLNEISVMNLENAEDSLKIVDQAIDDISRLRGRLGAFQKNALGTNLNNLRMSRENLTSADSNLRDADMAEEMSQLVKNQILFQAGTAMLAQANQMPQSVIQLLQSSN